MNMELKSFIKDGVEYYQLFAPCPRCCELGYYNASTPVSWVCGECGGDVYVGSNAHLYCSNCEKDFEMVFAHFQCLNCKQDGRENIVKYDRRIPHSYQALVAVTGVLCIDYALSPLWIKNFVEELMKQP